MSILFEPAKIGNLEIENRFVHSATYEGMAEESGEVTDCIVKRYGNLARGGIGLIIPGYFYVHPSGRSFNNQSGIHNDGMVAGLKRVVDAVHETDSKIAFQLVHAGRQTTKEVAGQTPIGPSATGRDPVNFVKPKQMTEGDIHETIEAFAKAAGRAASAGADAVQIHAAHGYLVSQFLSPFFNRRTDEFGGSDEGRFRFAKLVLAAIKKAVPDTMPVLIKFNANDYTPKQGVTPPLAKRYARMLAAEGIDGVEVSCGTVYYSFMNMCRGEVPVRELTRPLPFWKKPIAYLASKMTEGKFDMEPGYNREAAKIIKPALGKIPLMLVGGLRSVEHMEEILVSNDADFISMSRPFIREPNLVKKIKEGKAMEVACDSCNMCVAAITNGLPLRCYYKGLPDS